MKLELGASGLTEEEILHKTQLLMKAFGKEDASSTAEFMLMSKQNNAALTQAGLPPKDFTAVSRKCPSRPLLSCRKLALYISQPRKNAIHISLPGNTLLPLFCLHLKLTSTMRFFFLF